jgi:hypothetical protein
MGTLEERLCGSVEPIRWVVGLSDCPEELPQVHAVSMPAATRLAVTTESQSNLDEIPHPHLPVGRVGARPCAGSALVLGSGYRVVGGKELCFAGCLIGMMHWTKAAAAGVTDRRFGGGYRVPLTTLPLVGVIPVPPVSLQCQFASVDSGTEP